MNFNGIHIQERFISVIHVFGAKRAAIACGILLGALSLNAREINVPTQPTSLYVDTEVSTNLILNASRYDVKELNINLQFSGTASNNFEVAFGQDANTNGVLDVEEIDTTYGWRGGRYFIENVTGWNRIEEPAIVGNTSSVMDINIDVGANLTPISFAAICDGERVFEDISTEPPEWLYRSHWNLMRVVRRGAGTPSEWIRCTVNYDFVLILVR